MKNKIIFFDTETIAFPDDKPNDDVLCQLSFIVSPDASNDLYDGCTVYNDYMKPNKYKEFSIKAMAINKLTPEILETKKAKEETDSYNKLKEILENNTNKETIYLVAHNIKFDLQVLKQASINISENVKLIDTLKISEFINDNNDLMYEMNTLQYLKYFYRLDLERDSLDKVLNIDSSKLEAHDALNDTLDLMLLFNKLMKEFKGDLELFEDVSTNPFVLEYIPFGKNKGDRFTSLTYNQLKYYSTLEGNVGYTARQMLD